MRRTNVALGVLLLATSLPALAQRTAPSRLLPPAPQITSLSINNGIRVTDNQTVTLRWTYTGTATHYRIATSADFRDASSWQQGPEIGVNGRQYVLPAPANRMVTVYVQLQRQDAAGTVTSSPASATIQWGSLVLGPETLSPHGQVFSGPADLTTVLDCRNHGGVIVGIHGFHGEAVDKLGLICSGRRLASSVRLTAWGGEAGRPIGDRYCPTGQVVTGFSGSVAHGQLRGFDMRCHPLRADGLAPITNAGSIVSAGGTGQTNWPTESCTRGRPARAVRVWQNIFATDLLLPSLRPWVIVGIQMICEQPPS